MTPSPVIVEVSPSGDVVVSSSDGGVTVDAPVVAVVAEVDSGDEVTIVELDSAGPVVVSVE